MKVIVATNNQDKAKEIEAIMQVSHWDFLTLKEAQIESDPEETEDTLLGNARIKAYAARDAISKLVVQGRKDLEGCAVLADDSGLCVDALNGEPGVFSSRYAGEQCSYKDNCVKLLRSLEGVPDEKRTARFETDVVFLRPDGTEVVTKGYCEGRISTEEHGEGGFGYDPIFMPEAHRFKLSMAQLPEGGKNKISHRGDALAKLKIELEL